MIRPYFPMLLGWRCGEMSLQVHLLLSSHTTPCPLPTSHSTPIPFNPRGYLGVCEQVSSGNRLIQAKAML